MPDLFPGMEVPIAAQIEEVERELAMRAHVYPRRVAAGKMSERASDQQITALRAVLETLRKVRESHGR